MDVTRVSVSGPTRAPTGQTNAYVLGSDPAVLVDPPAQSDALDAELTDRRVEHVLVTHTHPDHVGGVAHYAAEHDATTWARYGRDARYREATGVTPEETFRDGDVVAGIEVLDTPGHASDHVAFVVEDDGDGEAVLCGDLAIAGGSVVVGYPDGDLRAYLTSLRRLRARAPDVMHPGHGPVIDDPRRTCERLIAHRLDREKRVLEAVDDGARTIPQIVDLAYEKDLTGVRDLATATVRAHVQKLHHEGRLDWTGDEETPVDR